MRHKVTWPALAAGVLVAAGCGGTAHRALPVVSITERDFHIRAPHEVPSGDVNVVLKNLGPVSHELLIIHAGRNPLPLRVDGFTIDENAVESRLVAAIEPEGVGTRDVVVHLTPGRYIVLCNMAGHAASGMETSFLAR
jgi:Sulfocyanin (SoxE) domain